MEERKKLRNSMICWVIMEALWVILVGSEIIFGVTKSYFVIVHIEIALVLLPGGCVRVSRYMRCVKGETEKKQPSARGFQIYYAVLIVIYSLGIVLCCFDREMPLMVRGLLAILAALVVWAAAKGWKDYQKGQK